MASSILKVNKSNRIKAINIATQVRRRRLAAVAAAHLIMEENEKKRDRVRWRRPWLEQHDEQGIFPNLVKEMEMADQVSYTNFLRMSPVQFNQLLTKVAPLIERQDTNFHKAVPPNERLGVTLRFLATGETFKSLSYSFRLGATTIGQIVPQTCQAIYEVLKDDFLKAPESQEDWLKIAHDFQERWDIPNTLGAIDGKHIAVQAPPNSGSVYYNYKHFFSIVLMGVVDANYQFVYVDIGSNGRISDGGVFAGCTLKEALDKKLANIPGKMLLPGDNGEMSFHLIGDEAFPLREDLMKPFPFRNLTQAQRIYNYRLSRGRRVVENAFGILAARFRVFLGRITLAPEKVEQLVMAACSLHNFLLSRRDSAYAGPGTLDEELEDRTVTPGSWRSTDSSMKSVRISQSNNAGFEPKDKRYKLTEYFSSPAGSVPWQYDMI